MAWIKTLLEASFRGFVFDIVKIDDAADRSTSESSYPYKNGADIEDMGRGPRHINIEAVFYGDNYEAQLQLFLGLLDTPGSGPFVHPVFGNFAQAQVLRYSVHHEADIQRAARFFYLQQHAFGGKVDGQNFGTATTAPTINLLRIEENLSAAHLRLAQGTTVENQSWQDCIKRYDREHTFFYCDPPYWQVEGYGVPFGFEQYEEMARVMRTCKGKMMVSINDHPDIRRAFDGLTMHDLGIKYSVANAHGKPVESRELIITNYSPGVMGGLF